MVQKQHIWRILLAIILVSLGIGIAGNLFIVNRLIAPTLQTVPTPPPSMPLESVEFVSAGMPVRGWYGETPHALACILLLHGVRRHRGEMLSRAEFLLQQGYSVFLFDFQAHGESPGETITFGVREAANVDDAVTYLRSRSPQTRLGALGFSLGGAATVLSGSLQEFDALILEAVYPTIERAVANRLRMHFGRIGGWFTPFLIWQLPWWLHATPDQLAPVAAMPRIACPVLIIGGAEDQRTRQEDTEALFEAAVSPKELWIIPGVAHENFHHVMTEEYEQRITTFFNRIFSKNGTDEKRTKNETKNGADIFLTRN